MRNVNHFQWFIQRLIISRSQRSRHSIAPLQMHLLWLGVDRRPSVRTRIGGAGHAGRWAVEKGRAAAGREDLPHSLKDSGFVSLQRAAVTSIDFPLANCILSRFLAPTSFFILFSFLFSRLCDIWAWRYIRHDLWTSLRPAIQFDTFSYPKCECFLVNDFLSLAFLFLCNGLSIFLTFCLSFGLLFSGFPMHNILLFPTIIFTLIADMPSN